MPPYRSDRDFPGETEKACVMPGPDRPFDDSATGPFYVHTQDFVDAFVGPFDTAADARRHIDSVIVPRGDGGFFEVIGGDEFRATCGGWLVMTPADDAAWSPDA